MKLVPVLLAGGSGTRLWPLSREQFPKQLLKLLDERSLLQSTALRARNLPGAVPPLALCGERHRFIVAEQLQELCLKGSQVLLEPQGRNTAPAAAVAVLAVVLVVALDSPVVAKDDDQAVNNSVVVRWAVLSRHKLDNMPYSSCFFLPLLCVFLYPGKKRLMNASLM